MSPFKRAATALAWSAVLVGFAACASDESNYGSTRSLGVEDGGSIEAGTPAATGGMGTGTCNPTFCPATTGTACCVSPSGPCGVDLGNGCVSQVQEDAGP